MTLDVLRCFHSFVEVLIKIFDETEVSRWRNVGLLEFIAPIVFSSVRGAGVTGLGCGIGDGKLIGTMLN